MKSPLSSRCSRLPQFVKCLLVATVLLTGLVVLTPPVFATDPDLHVLDKELKLTPDEDDIWATLITLHNTSDARLCDLTPDTILVDSSGTRFTQALEIKSTDGQTCIDGHSVDQFTIQVPTGTDGPAIEKSVSGYLVIKTTPDKVTEPVPLSLIPAQEGAVLGIENLDFALVIWVSLGFGVLALVSSAVILVFSHPGGPKKGLQTLWKGDLGPIKWDFKQNWAATATGLGGIAGTIYGLTILPKTTQFLTTSEDVNEFTILAALFGLGTALAPIVGTVCTTLNPIKARPGEARVRVYILAASLVVWTAAGETLVGLVFLEEVRQGSTTYRILAYLQWLLIALGLSVLAYSIRKTVDTILDLIKKRKQPQAVRDLRDAVTNASQQIQGDYPGTVAMLKTRVESRELKWVLGSLFGTPTDKEPFVPVTLASISQTMIKCLDPTKLPANDATAFLTPMASGLEMLEAALENQMEKPQGVPAAVNWLRALAEKPTQPLPMPVWRPVTGGPVLIPVEPIYLP